MCAPASSLVRKRPVDSTTYSAPISFHRRFAGSFSAVTRMVLPFTTRLPSLHSTVPVKMAVNGVVTEHVSHVINRNEVVDAYHLYAALLDGGTENEAADAETVDADFNL